MATDEPMLLPFNESYDGTDVNPGGNPARFITGAEDGLTAHSGGGHAGLALSTLADVHRITTVAADHDSVLLPASQAGLNQYVVNAGAHILDIYGLGTDTINAIAANSPLSIAAGKTVLLTCPVAGAWYGILTA
jgi:hypothetical protein